MNARIATFTVFALLALSSCFAPEDQLTVGDLTLIDSFFRMERETLQLQLVDSCVDYRAALLPTLIDSIRAERYAEIQNLIDDQR